MYWTCAFTFAVYCNITRKYAGGQNLVTFFFVMTAMALWLKYSMGSEVLTNFTLPNTLELVVAGAAMAGGYALWNQGIIKAISTRLLALRIVPQCCPLRSLRSG